VWPRLAPPTTLLTKHERLLRLEKATAERTPRLTGEQVKRWARFSPEPRERRLG
jgi:hypothetical protein